MPVASGLDAARRTYLEWCVKLDADLDAELEAVRAAFKEIVGKRARASEAQTSLDVAPGRPKRYGPG